MTLLLRSAGYEPEELTQWLREAGFTKITLTGDMTGKPPKPEEDRLIFLCEKPR